MKKKIIEIVEDTELGGIEVNSLEETIMTNIIMQVLKDNFLIANEIEFYKDWE